MLISCVLLLTKNKEFAVNSKERLVLLNRACKLCDHKLKLACASVCMIIRLCEVLMSGNARAVIPMFFTLKQTADFFCVECFCCDDRVSRLLWYKVVIQSYCRVTVFSKSVEVIGKVSLVSLT